MLHSGTEWEKEVGEYLLMTTTHQSDIDSDIKVADESALND